MTPGAIFRSDCASWPIADVRLASSRRRRADRLQPPIAIAFADRHFVNASFVARKCAGSSPHLLLVAARQPRTAATRKKPTPEKIFLNRELQAASTTLVVVAVTGSISSHCNSRRHRFHAVTAPRALMKSIG